MQRYHSLTNKVILKELLAEKFAYLSMVWSVPLKKNKWRTKEEMTGLKKHLQKMNSV